MVQIALTRAVESPFLVDEADGILVFQSIAPLLKQGQTVSLSFEGAQTVTTSFLNRAVGDLFGQVAPEVVEQQLIFECIDAEDLRRIERVKLMAAAFYQDPESFQSLREQALADFV